MTEVIFCQEAEGRSPVVEWLEQLRRMNAAAFAKGTAVIQRLAADGHALRRTTADILRDGIHELRAKHGRVNYRILYFFHGRNVAILPTASPRKPACRRTRSIAPSDAS